MLKKLLAIATLSASLFGLSACHTGQDETKNELNAQTACVNINYEMNKLQANNYQNISSNLTPNKRVGSNMVPNKRLSDLQEQYKERGCDQHFTIDHQ
jgi:hypothetical protein